MVNFFFFAIDWRHLVLPVLISAFRYWTVRIHADLWAISIGINFRMDLVPARRETVGIARHTHDLDGILKFLLQVCGGALSKFNQSLISSFICGIFFCRLHYHSNTLTSIQILCIFFFTSGPEKTPVILVAFNVDLSSFRIFIGARLSIAFQSPLLPDFFLSSNLKTFLTINIVIYIIIIRWNVTLCFWFHNGNHFFRNDRNLFAIYQPTLVFFFFSIFFILLQFVIDGSGASRVERCTVEPCNFHSHFFSVSLSILRMLFAVIENPRASFLPFPSWITILDVSMPPFFFISKIFSLNQEWTLFISDTNLFLHISSVINVFFRFFQIFFIIVFIWFLYFLWKFFFIFFSNRAWVIWISCQTLALFQVTMFFFAIWWWFLYFTGGHSKTTKLTQRFRWFRQIGLFYFVKLNFSFSNWVILLIFFASFA